MHLHKEYTTLKNYVLNKKPKGSNEITAVETMTKNKAGTEFITGFVDDVYKNSGVTSSVDGWLMKHFFYHKKVFLN